MNAYQVRASGKWRGSACVSAGSVYISLDTIRVRLTKPVCIRPEGRLLVETLGSYLKSKREAAGISLQEISQVTRIRRSILEAIENDRYDLLPPKVFAHGFIRSYALYLGLDESEVIKRYAEQVEAPDPDARSAEKSRTSSLVRSIGIIAVVVMGLVAARGLIKTLSVNTSGLDNTNPGTKPAATSLMPETSVLDQTARERDISTGKVTAVPEAGKGISTSSGVDQPPLPDAQSEPSGGTVNPIFESVAARTSTDAGNRVSGIPSTVTAPLELKIIASQITWMRLRSDTDRPVEFTLRAGETRVFKARERFTLRIGNAGGVTLFLNERALGTPGKPGEVLDMTLPE